MEVNDKDQRRAQRSALLLEVTFEGAGVRTETRISDISVSGIYIETVSQVPLGSSLKLAFTLPDGHVVRTEGVVAHTQARTGIGVRFTDLDPEDELHIRKVIHE